MWICGTCGFSFFVGLAVYGLKDRGVYFGLAQLARLLQVVIAALATSKLRLTMFRVKVLGVIATVAFLFTVIGVLLTAVLPIITVIPGLAMSRTPAVAGPWSSYAVGAVPGVGFVGYNHAYTGMQLLLLAGLSLSLNRYSVPMRVIMWAALMASTFASESRAGFLCGLLMVLGYELKRSKTTLLVLAIIGFALSAYLVGTDGFQRYAERQQSAATALNENGISGRTDIWQEHITYFEEHPLALIWGSGFGFNSHASENNAHNLYLHVTTEMGLFGLAAFLLVFWKIMPTLKRSPAMWLTVVSLLLTGLTQETFYPVLAFPGFLPFFFSAAVAAVRTAAAKKVTMFAYEFSPS
jgi:hypothetical protein